jgi:hypothetical protein
MGQEESCVVAMTLQTLSKGPAIRLAVDVRYLIAAG